MKRKVITSSWHALAPYRVRVQLVALSTPDLGTWQIYEWELFENGEFVAKGSLPYGDNYILVSDVLDQLEYEYLSKATMETVIGPYGDADPGL